MPTCETNKILNPATNRCVLKTGKIGKLIILNKKKVSNKKTPNRSKRRSSKRSKRRSPKRSVGRSTKRSKRRSPKRSKRVRRVSNKKTTKRRSVRRSVRRSSRRSARFSRLVRKVHKDERVIISFKPLLELVDITANDPRWFLGPLDKFGQSDQDRESAGKLKEWYTENLKWLESIGGFIFHGVSWSDDHSRLNIDITVTNMDLIWACDDDCLELNKRGDDTWDIFVDINPTGSNPITLKRDNISYNLHVSGDIGDLIVYPKP